MKLLNAIWFWFEHELIMDDIDLELEKGDIE